ncbi:unnamed protein product [Ilex paraguariensis]|uniref:UFSP2 second domain-containing protein n=1 Tax=Ilex paraguariensis TaxID=185542 RepID=A0ABC8RFD3_9AQUA
MAEDCGHSHDAEDVYLCATETITAKLRDPQVTYVIETLNGPSTEAPLPVILRGTELDINTDLSGARLLNDTAQGSDAKSLPCSNFCLRSKDIPSFLSIEESADKIQVTVLFNKSENSSRHHVPTAKYFPALEEAKGLIVNYNLEVLCYAAKDLSLTYAVSKLIIPGLADQLHAMKRTILPNLLTQNPQKNIFELLSLNGYESNNKGARSPDDELHPYHFSPPGILHPITVIYELSFGEAELKQVEGRRSIHLKLGLPFDRPLLRIANAIKFSTMKKSAKSNLTRKGNQSISNGLNFVQSVIVCA